MTLLRMSLAALLLAPSLGFGDAGDLDPTFGTGGVVTTAIGTVHELAEGIAQQPDGKLVIAGETVNGTSYDFFFARYDLSGVLDPTFGTGGKTKVTGVGRQELATAMVLQYDGKIVVAGHSYGSPLTGDFALARVDANGALDPTFGTGGAVRTPIGASHDVAYALIQQADGKLVAAGTALGGPGNDYDVALARYDASGTLDPTFGSGGIVVTSIGSDYAIAQSLVEQPDGRLVVLGYTIGAIVLLRYDTAGALDPTFGTGGIVTMPFGSTPRTLGNLVRQPDGKLVAAGFASNGIDDDFAVARFDAAGALDPTFGTGGWALTPIGPARDSATGLVLQADGMLVATGSAQNGVGRDVAIVRYDANGVLDPTFGAGGIVTTRIGASYSQAHTIVRLADGRYVVAGSHFNGTNDDVALVRYLDNVCGDAVFEPGEACDDGGLAAGDCCSPTCTLDAGGPDADADGICDGPDNCPVDANPEQPDADGDETGDACDACTGGAGATKAKLLLTKLLAPAGDDRLAFKGQATLPFPFSPALNPAASGLRIVVVDADGVPVVDALVSAGPYSAISRSGWLTGSSTMWRYKNPGTHADGITAVLVKTVPSEPGLVRFKVTGKNATYPLDATRLPLRATITFDPPAAPTGLCTDATWPAAPPVSPSCAAAGGGAVVKCR